MKNIEEYKEDIELVLSNMAKIEVYIDVASDHEDDESFKNIFGNFVKDGITGFMKIINDLTDAMKRSIVLEYLTSPIDSDKTTDIVEVYTNLEFIEKQMKIIRAKHAIYYFNVK